MNTMNIMNVFQEEQIFTIIQTISWHSPLYEGQLFTPPSSVVVRNNDKQFGVLRHLLTVFGGVSGCWIFLKQIVYLGRIMHKEMSPHPAFLQFVFFCNSWNNFQCDGAL